MLRKVLIGAAVVAMLVTLAACGGSNKAASPTSTPTPSGTTGSDTTTTTQPAIKEGGVLRYGTTNYVDSFNPWNYIEAQSVMVFAEVYPAFVQFDKDYNYVGDWATKWENTPDGLTWTFHLTPGGKWSDGTPLTADDAAWTINTTIKYKDDATAVQATAVDHIASAEAPDENTVVVHYDAAIGNVLSKVGVLSILPRHVYEPLEGTNGKGLKTFKPEQHMPIVTAGAFTVVSYQKKGTTVLKPDPNFYGPKAHVDAVAVQFYTNADAMIADLKGGKLDYVDQVPFKAAKTVQTFPGVTVNTVNGAEITNITWNSNPKKKQHKELLDPAVKKALSMSVDRQRIIDVVFEGFASPVDTLVGHIAGPWENKNVGPLVYDLAAANAALDQLGYAKGADGIRVAPAANGEAAHPMAYDIMTPTSTDFDIDRVFQIVKDGFAQLGVKVTQVSGGDSTAAYAYETGDNCDAKKGTGYENWDIALWDWVPYPEPDFQLSVVTKGQWCSWSDTGWDNPEFDALYAKQGTTVDPAARKVLVDQAQQMIYDAFVYTQLVNEQTIDAHANGWDGFDARLNGYSKTFLTDPHQV